MKNQKIIFCFFALLLIFGINFINSVDEEVSNTNPAEVEANFIKSIDALKANGQIDYSVSEEDDLIRITFNEVEELNIGENHFENVKNINKNLDSYIKVDRSGKILEAYLYNDKPAHYIINGNEFDVPEENYFSYSGYSDFNNFNLPEGTNVTKLSEGIPIIGKEINLPDGIFLSEGKAYLSNLGYIFEGDFIYEGISFSAGDALVIKDSSFDASTYNASYIQKSSNNLKIQSTMDYGMDFNFLDGNGIVDMSNVGLDENKEKYLNLGVYGGDSIEIYKPKIIEGLPTRIVHEGNGPIGYTEITNGKNIFKFENGEFIGDFSNLNLKDKEAVPLDINSNILGSKTLLIHDNNKYNLWNYDDGTLLTFDMSPEGHDYKFNSEIGKKLYNFAEGELGESAFVWGGRGDVCYTDTGRENVPTQIKGYDCIGYAITGLTKVYPDSSIKDFPPSLKLVDTLKEKGWKSYIVEPTSIAGESKTIDSVKNIPAGAIVFLMHPEKSFYYGKKNIDYINYKDSEGKEIFLQIGHTLIRGKGKDNFLNAIPSYDSKLMPKEAVEYDEQLMEQGKSPFFQGAVKEGNLIPQNDYLYVIVPPKN